MKLQWLAAAALTAGSATAKENGRPRGVGPEFGKYYKDVETFTCIASPSIHLSRSRVNDDFCDCPDGSDEPGTAACAYLSHLSPHTLADVPAPTPRNTSLSLPGFYCKNKGHRPSYIPFDSVNDGVCDYSGCCDGSDEWAHPGQVKCSDRCAEIGAAWRQQDEQRQRSLSAAAKQRAQLVAEAGRLRKEVEDRLESLLSVVEADRVKIGAFQKAVADAERAERGRIVKKPKTGGKVAMLVQLARGRIEELREMLISVKMQRDERAERIQQLEGILSTFKQEYNPNFNDEGVKRAVRGWEDYAAQGHPELGGDDDADELSREDGASGVINWDEFEASESDVDVLYKFEEYLPEAARTWLDQKLRALRILLVEHGVVASTHDTENESKELGDARSSLKAAEDVLSENQRKVDENRGDLDKQYGTDGVFRAMQGRCITKDSGEYTYEMCWMTHTKQKSKKGGSETLMGMFFGFDSTSVDEDLPADGKGIGRGERMTLKYQNGQTCWNGPARSTVVVLACADKDELWKVVEEEKCVYRMEVGTPAACESAKSQENDRVRDEL